MTSRRRDVFRGAGSQWYQGLLSRKQAEALYRLAVIDSLSGCYNRHFFDQVVAKEYDRHQRYGTPLSVLFVDLDNLKKVNDNYGHSVGDQVLRQVAQCLLQHTRESDYVFRWGGDEFLILTACTGTEAQRKASELRSMFKKAAQARELPPDVGLSIGHAELGQDGKDVNRIIRLADRRMYTDKRARQRATLKRLQRSR